MSCIIKFILRLPSGSFKNLPGPSHSSRYYERFWTKSFLALHWCVLGNWTRGRAVNDSEGTLLKAPVKIG